MDLNIGFQIGSNWEAEKYKTKDWAHSQAKTNHKSRQTSEAVTSRTREARFALYACIDFIFVFYFLIVFITQNSSIRFM